LVEHAEDRLLHEQGIDLLGLGHVPDHQPLEEIRLRVSRNEGEAEGVLRIIADRGVVRGQHFRQNARLDREPLAAVPLGRDRLPLVDLLRVVERDHVGTGDERLASSVLDPDRGAREDEAVLAGGTGVAEAWIGGGGPELGELHQRALEEHPGELRLRPLHPSFSLARLGSSKL
jgi:hypothetical protein